MLRHGWLTLALAALLAHCGDGPAPTEDAAGTDALEVATRDAAEASAIAADAGADAASSDAAHDVPTLDAPDVPALDVTELDAPELDAPDLDAPDHVEPDHVEPIDIALIEDLPFAPPDMPVDDVPIVTDAPTSCPTGLTDRCPTTAPGPCPALVPGRPTVVRFGGLRATVLMTCEGSVTRNARDGLIPLVINTPSDVTITAQPTGSDLVVLALYRAGGCGLPSGEVRCVNPGRLGDTARLMVSSLEPGTYYVSLSSVLGSPTTVTATPTPARPRRRGDVCPGVPITPDGPAVTLDTANFQTTADDGTVCGAASSSSSWVDGVFSYTLTEPRDVTVTVDTVEGGGLAMELRRSCGRRESAVPPCVTGTSVRRTVRNQEPGTWYVSVDRRASSGGRTLRARVTTATPTPLDPADRCPGVALTEGVVTVTPVEAIQGDAPQVCLRSPRADAYYSFVAPPAGHDVLVHVQGQGEPVSMTLQSTCGGEALVDCIASGEREAPNLWRRLQGLTPDQRVTLAVGAAQSRDTLGVSYVTVPAAVRTAVSGNNSCSRAATIPREGGLFTGSNSAGDRSRSIACGGLACFGGRRVYYRLDLTERRRVVLSALGSSFDTVLSLYSGECPGRAVDGACSDDAIGSAALVDVTLAPGRYTAVLAGCGISAEGNYALDVSLHAP
ncbi:MAG: hypothetical protein R3A48_09840 [Polyangiales bacterium]